MFGSAGRPCYMFYASPAMAAKQYSLLIYFAGLFVDITNVINAKLTNKRAARLSQVKSMFQKTVRTINRSTRTLHLRFREPQLLDLAMKITLLSLGITAELKRKCARERYPLLKKELKEDRNKKRRDSRKRRKDESIGFYKLTHLLLSKFGLFEHNTLLLLN
uniref:Uncharacterized protein n=1 Tax=Oryza nivara TaxID=4536 RepID=A0A0E0IBF1_ORYNI